MTGLVAPQTSHTSSPDSPAAAPLGSDTGQESRRTHQEAASSRSPAPPRPAPPCCPLLRTPPPRHHHFRPTCPWHPDQCHWTDAIFWPTGSRPALPEAGDWLLAVTAPSFPQPADGSDVGGGWFLGSCRWVSGALMAASPSGRCALERL